MSVVNLNINMIAMKIRQLLQYIHNATADLRFCNAILDPFPNEIHFALTNRCNLSCKFCGQAQDKWRREDELTYDQYKNIIDQVANMKNRTVSFSGGEIFLYSDIERILEYCKHKRLTISMILTNGTLLNEQRIKTLIESGVKHIGFSIDGKRETHDKIRGLKGAYEKTISAINTLNEIKQSRGITSPTIGINFVITSETMFDMEAVVNVASKLDVSSLNFSYLNYISEKKLSEQQECMKLMYPDYNFCYWEGFLDNDTSIDVEELIKIITRIEHHTSSCGCKIVYSYPPNKVNIDRWYNSDESMFNKCTYIRNCFLVLPNGDYPLCDFIRYPVGNVNNRSLLELWYDNKARTFRKMVSMNLPPGCERCCSLS